MAETNVDLLAYSIDENGKASATTPEMPGDVRAFAATHGIGGFFGVAAKLIERHFTLDAPLGFSRIDDPESDSQWIEIYAKVLGDVSAVQTSHSNYTRDWLASVPLDKSSLIRLALDLG